MKNKEYWEKRSEQIASKQFKKTDEYVTSMIKEYEKAKLSIQQDIEIFYQRFAIENKVDMSEAKKLLGGRESSEFKMTLEEFTSKAKNNTNGIWEQELNNVSYKVRVSRLEALQTQIRHQVEMVMNGQLEGMNRLLSDIYEDTYYRNIYEFQKGLGIGVNFAKLDTNTIEKAIAQKWMEGNFSSRVWDNRTKLLTELQTTLVQSLIRGDSIDKTSRLLADRMNVSRSRAATLVNTESAYITNKATMDSYKNSGVVKEYEVLATLDLSTSQICRSMDGNIFKVSEMQPGVNAPPFHPNCRTTTIAYFSDTIDENRIARDSDGNVYYVDGNMNYKEWYEKYVESDPEELLAEKKLHNKYSDTAQHSKYKLIFGDKIPSKLEDFQELKYNNIKEWENIKTKKQDTLNSLDYRDSLYGKLGNKEVREWYVHKCSDIPNVIDKSKDIKEQAMESYSLRNKYKTEARLMMKDRKEAERLNLEEAIKTFEQLVDYKVKYKKLSLDEVYKDIIGSSSTTRKSVNEKFGVN
ncbi:minor capsid protein [Alkaliphilus sp. B6464]|uniref:minor capsid protein n=1 Tax=Alkaliphilus sp. B6464 TaxID=2731219 RepID=UPI001BA902BC|nr:minor capsid protein [Alkaliphilus sp. B6464]QUH21428.1 minor capsid protein [Alkaliphilus sp. B6464]